MIKRNVAVLHGITVASNSPFIVYGPVRGVVSEHRSEQAAFRALKQDQDACEKASTSGYSDACVYLFDDTGEDGWIRCFPLDED